MHSCKLSVLKNEDLSFCEACQFGKSHALPYTLSTSRAVKPFALVHTNLWGPTPMSSTDGFKYYVIFLDDFSRFVWIYPLRQKSDTLAAFTHFQTMVQTQFATTIQALQSDNGTEYSRIHQLCSQQGILSRFSCPYTSAQNGRAERKHRHVVENGLTLLAQAAMPLSYWWDAFLTAVFLINSLPTSVLDG